MSNMWNVTAIDEAIGHAVDEAMSVDWPTSFDAMEDLTEYTTRRDGVVFCQRVA
tara:strand:+ start:255 stop:416 length:162 start_codon:yes stop_codon:yes gene_type:complete